ncbi:hypothetical protein [uncultured Martelella sp.]|uniref:hypothetical protein n=1 Tax=uncultured Martelella sp. TaxID=392331 RepID=UPI0029C92F00|nr:hypothetical protein [uncultured Martelella sp.]
MWGAYKQNYPGLPRGKFKIFLFVDDHARTGGETQKSTKEKALALPSAAAMMTSTENRLSAMLRATLWDSGLRGAMELEKWKTPKTATGCRMAGRAWKKAARASGPVVADPGKATEMLPPECPH